jgi:predicted ArsR family transcriptional regulator
MGESQRKILNHLKRSGLSTIRALAADLGLNVETVRTHVRSLRSDGLVRRAGSRRGGKGRPEILYELTESAEDWFPSREGEILEKLASYLERAGARDLVRGFFDEYVDERRAEALDRVAGLTGDARIQEVARILTEDGFMAQAGKDAKGRPVLSLSHCPMRRLVDVTKAPCRAELALVRELLGGRPVRIEYLPHGDAACSYVVADPASPASTNHQSEDEE